MLSSYHFRFQTLQTLTFHWQRNGRVQKKSRIQPIREQFIVTKMNCFLLLQPQEFPEFLCFPCKLVLKFMVTEHQDECLRSQFKVKRIMCVLSIMYLFNDLKVFEITLHKCIAKCAYTQSACFSKVCPRKDKFVFCPKTNFQFIQGQRILKSIPTCKLMLLTFYLSGSANDPLCCSRFILQTYSRFSDKNTVITITLSLDNQQKITCKHIACTALLCIAVNKHYFFS